MKPIKIILISFPLLIILNCSKDRNDIAELSYDSYPFNGMDLTDVFFINTSTGFAIGRDGLIQKTTNFGETWNSEKSGTSLNLTSVFFINSNWGVATGEYMTQCSDDDCNKSSVFLKTTDGGNNWIKQFNSPIARFYDLLFFNENDGVAILETMNSETYAATTNDGGRSWQYLNLSIQRIFFSNNHSIELIFVKDDVCYVIGDNQLLYKSNDYGKNWETMEVPIQILGACFISKNQGFIVNKREIYKTRDGGLSWIKLPCTNIPFGFFHFYDELNGFSITYRSEYIGGDFPSAVASIIYSTSDGGITWNTKEVKDIISGYISFPTNQLGYCINQDKIYKLKLE